MPAELLSITTHAGIRALAQLLGVLTHRQVELLAMTAHREGNGRYRIALEVDVPDVSSSDLLHKRINRIVSVVRTVPRPSESTHSRQAVLIRVAVDTRQRAQVCELARAFSAEIIEIVASCVTVSYLGETSRIEELLALLEPYGLLDVARSGTIALRRGKPARDRRLGGVVA